MNTFHAHDRVALDGARHRVEVRLEVADVRERLRVQQHAFVVAQRLGDAGAPGPSISGDSGLPSGAIGSADSTTIDVSLRRNTSSMKWSIEKQTRDRPRRSRCCGNAAPEVAALR